jgi:hypothetical protein
MAKSEIAEIQFGRPSTIAKMVRALDLESAIGMLTISSSKSFGDELLDPLDHRDLATESLQVNRPSGGVGSASYTRSSQTFGADLRF